MKPFFLLLTVLFSLFSCSKKNINTDTLIDFSPNNPSVIISAPNMNTLQKELSENLFIKSFNKTTVAMAHRLARLVWILLQRQELYKPQFCIKSS